MNSYKSFLRLKIFGYLAVASANLLALQNVKAQLVPDSTLGAENSSVVSQDVRDLIEGGARRGRNLFHSFVEFNVGNNQQVYFANPLGIANILTRVTGNNVSNIFGTLGVEGAANLFLINPNGIIFGANARLDISGSFLVSTTDGIKLGENGLFSATEPEKSTLLSIQPGVLFTNSLHSHQAEIRNQGNLAAGTGQTLTLQADSVTSTGGLAAPGGTVQVLGERVSLLNNASIDVSAPTGGGTVLIGNGSQIDIGSGVRIDANALQNGDGGTVIVKSNDTIHFEGEVSARGGKDSGNGGFVEVSGGTLQFSGIVDTSAPNGKVGTLLLDPKDILIQQGGTLSGLAVSQLLFLNDVILQANNDITVNDNIIGIGANSLTLLAGRSLSIAPNRTVALNGGNFTAKINDENTVIPAERDPGIAQFVMNPGSRILTNGGNITITSGTFGQTSQINTVNAALITSNLAGNSGNITLFALGDITIGLLDTRSGTGNGGDISVTSAGGAIATTNSVLTDSLTQAGDILLTAAGNLSLTADNFDINGNITSNGAVPGKITLTSGAILSGRGIVLANTIFGSGTPNGITNGITLTAQSIVLEDSLVTANTFSDTGGGDLLVNATDEVILRNSTLSTNANSLSANFRPTGDAGNLTVNTRRLTIIRDPGSTFPFPVGVGTLANPVSDGDAGNLTINASESVEIIGNQPGTFTIPSNQEAQAILQLVDTGPGISTSALGGGNSGNLTVNTGRLVVRDGAGITTFPVQGKGGDLTVNATEIFLQGQGGIATTTTPFGQEAGNLTLNAEQVTLTDGAAIATATFGSAKAGELNLSARQISIRNGSAIVTTTLGQGDGGPLTINNSELIEVIGTSSDGSFVSSIGANSVGAGKAGTLNIETEQLSVQQGGQVTVSAQGTSNAGDININARSIFLAQGSISATSTSGEGGNINLRVANNLLLRNGSQISTRAGSQPSDRGNGGNMNINAQFVVAVPRENSDITANAFAGNGGNINISAEGIFGLQVSDELTPKSDITASSQLGIDGTVSINTLDIDPSRGLTELPANFSDPSNQVVAGCPADTGNKFAVTGRGGIPDNPSQYLREGAVWLDTRDLSGANRPTHPIANNQQPTTNNQPLIEAQGWSVDERGTVTLTAEPYAGEQPNPLVVAQSCQETSK